jgi:hypothetical protein
MAEFADIDGYPMALMDIILCSDLFPLDEDEIYLCPKVL